MKKYTIETDKFKDANELNLFIIDIENMRKKQSEYDEAMHEFKMSRNKDISSIESQKVLELIEELEQIEAQVDAKLKSFPPITAIFL